MNKRFTFHFEYNKVKKLLVNVTNIGTDANPDLKLSFTKKPSITCGDTGISYNHPNCDQQTFTSNNIEMTYHKDGSYLRKLPKNTPPYKYYNPFGTGKRFQSLDSVNSFICLATIEVQNYSICDEYVMSKKTLPIGIIEDNLFNGEPFIAIIYVKNKNFIINKLSCELFYSTYVHLSPNLDIGIYIQRIERKYPKRIYSEALKSYIYTTIGNTVSFCDNTKGLIPFINLVTDTNFHKAILEQNITDVVHIKLK
ncbi:hypothetical protein [Dysgonomonas sp. ZJ279]|uniref:hypothetical protein n=1 Tax=Dysgonomonas sp. ZJ279 TaxID=2709796 RepID=UPI0013EAC78E|nr:hypothetical protein [Dysgonomonas sp. ZJ279]